ncbi:MAG: UDP-N-acetylmuramate--L-alanine ligase [Oscillospiraceae bacterium]|nr:UDP-N-acetylmuramate--L-alanine ligase [Oscillospiraceae bacterium]
MVSHAIHEYLRPGCRAHLVGIGGVSMSPLAEVLHGAGLSVTGSDMQEGDSVSRLRGLGINVTIGHLPESVQGADCIIRTAAVHDDNPEIAAARAAGIPVFERAQAWGAIMRHYKNALCVAGTHGKTTTTSMCTHIFIAAQADPTVMIGGALPLLGSGHRVGEGDTIILESCEYCDSFLSFFPTVAVILNVDADHLDYFKDLSAVEHSFRSFARLVPENGCVVANAEDPNTMETLAQLDRPLVTFGVEQGDVCARDLQWHNGLPSFDIMIKGQFFAHIALQVPGMHNVKNALAAAAAAYVLGVPSAAVEDGLGSFIGAGRRFEHKGSFRGAEIYDDYAHHPSELEALLTTAKTLGYDRVVCAFQPHTYTRTKEFFHDFARVLTLADVVLLAEIYAAREKNSIGISSRDLLPHIPGAEYFPTLDDLTDALEKAVRPGDLVLTVGAGNIYTVGQALLARG